ncbi:MAG: phage adaptor protein [Sulfuricurvum sp.]
MTATEVISLARVGELLQLSPTIKEDATVLGFINLGLLEIYKRFTIKTGEALITLRSPKTIYLLDGTDPDVSITEPYFYLISAYEEGEDRNDYTTDDKLVPINSEDDIYSINTISYDRVQIPLVTDGSIISLIYAVKPTKVTLGDLGNELPLPDQFVEALLNYIGYRAHGSMDGNIQTESNTHYMRFEASCNKIKELGVGTGSDDLDMNTRLSMRGFV